LEKGRAFFFRGSALQVFGQCGGTKCGLGKAKIFFLGERIFRFASADFPPAGRVWGGMRAGFEFAKKIFESPISSNQNLQNNLTRF